MTGTSRRPYTYIVDAQTFESYLAGLDPRGSWVTPRQREAYRLARAAARDGYDLIQVFAIYRDDWESRTVPGLDDLIERTRKQREVD